MFKQHRVRSSRKILAVLGLAISCLGGIPAAQAAKVSERAKQKQLAETEHADLQQKLSALKRDIDRTETAKSSAADALAHSETAISRTNRTLHELQEEQQRIEARLAQLSKEQADLAKAVETQQQRLAKLMREQYVTGNEDRIKLLLSGDNPNRINRDLQYMAYVSQAQAKMIEKLRADLLAVESNKTETQNAKDDLDEIAQEASQQKALLEKEKGRHAALLSQLSGKLVAQRKEAGNIEHDEQRLAGLLDKLSKLIEEQQRAETAAVEKRRQEQQALQARAKAERDKRAQQAKNSARDNKATGKIKYPDPVDKDEAPPKSLARNELIPEDSVQSGALTQSFSALRGQLHLPLKGELIAKYGSKRGDGPNWKGLFIRAVEGSEVKAIAPGRVIFAEWLRGFGNLIILDHGSQYMSIYGNNQAVLKRAGDTVKSGEVIASAGNSGGNEQSGLYFEMRHQGRAFDPLEWVTLR